jgi:hypothetical protein
VSKAPRLQRLALERLDLTAPQSIAGLVAALDAAPALRELALPEVCPSVYPARGR